MRQKLNAQIEAQILFLNRHTCCHCRERGKDVQIHHIDENNINNRLDNLAVLCLDCHSKVTGGRGLGKRFSKLEVKKYKEEWELIVKKQFGFSKIKAKVPKVEKELFIFEIKRIVYELLAVDEKEKSTMIKNFETLLNIAMFEDLLIDIIDLLQIPLSLIADSSKKKAVLLAQYLPQFFDYLLGPKEFDLDKKEEKALVEAVKTLNFILIFSIEDNKDYFVLNAIKNSAEDFIEISIEYKNNRVFRESIKLLQNLRASANTIYYKKDRKYPRLSSQISESLLDIKKELKKRRLRWTI